ISIPLLPLNNVPPSTGQPTSTSMSSGRGGRVPSNQVSFTGGKPSRGGKRKVTIAESGWTSASMPQEVASTVAGGPSFKDQFTTSRVWAPRSPIMPQPKSHQQRQVVG